MQENNYSGSVLLSDEIKRYADELHLIEPFEERNLKPASYYLTVGEEYAIGGVYRKLEDEPGKNEITIPPFEVVIIRTYEKLNMPTYLIGRWNIRVTLAYKGLVWVGGPQVDPGFNGHLMCPIYNLSSREVTLKLKDRLATIDFVKTTSFVDERCKKFEQKRFEFKDYEYNLSSALYTEAAERIDTLEKKLGSVAQKTSGEIEKFGSKLDWYVGILFTIVGVLIAALSILVASAKSVHVASPIWLYSSPVVAFGAILISLWSLRNRKLDGTFLDKVTVACIILSAAALVILVGFMLWMFA